MRSRARSLQRARRASPAARRAPALRAAGDPPPTPPNPPPPRPPRTCRLNDKGGDWDRRNRLKVYEGIALLTARDFAGAAALLLDSLATFTAHEVISYERFILLTVVAALKTLERPALKKRVVDSPDVLSVIDGVPHLGELLGAFYGGRYRDFLAALCDIYPALTRDRYLGAHAAYYLREMRVAAYAQFLQSYKRCARARGGARRGQRGARSPPPLTPHTRRSVTIAGMSRIFGVTPAFLDGELSRFIASGRIAAKIDAVAGIIETVRPEPKNAQYAQVLKLGDALLAKTQKLARAAAL